MHADETKRSRRAVELGTVWLREINEQYPSGWTAERVEPVAVEVERASLTCRSRTHLPQHRTFQSGVLARQCQSSQRILYLQR